MQHVQLSLLHDAALQCAYAAVKRFQYAAQLSQLILYVNG